MPKRFFPRPLAAALALLALLALLAGCWVPEHYISRIKIETDGTYKVYVEGTAVHPDGLRAARRLEAEAKSGKLKGEDLKKRQAEAQERLQKDMDALKGDKRVMNLSSIGDGRVRFTLGGTWSMDRNLLIFSEAQAPLSYAVGTDGTMRIRVKDAVSTREAQNLEVKTEGDLSVVLAEGIEVLEHNAQKTPTSPVGAYRWHIDATTREAPYLKLRLPEAKGRESRAQTPGGATQKKLAHP